MTHEELITWAVANIPEMTVERATFECNERLAYQAKDVAALQRMRQEHPEWMAVTYNED